jgi:hypothetical protein
MIAAWVGACALHAYIGHRPIGITLDSYGHLTPGNDSEAGIPHG